ncbi:ubiquitin carboxyl-terminal hydrolase-like protein isozyme L3 [Gloeophyllum trabeum ATCC 11539]|uniref:Ubiquitin carboxyl-terminal hydrolase n=1 Tax=Gloeophyllum trabeum (strain ATCC 11539 / FP-39264 / Madison 617) TaxID=670483 RepID=S7QA11_GLOTA|nr:ubiquitin carboxyl-terminal hydrolase-like protein isozyme L3 [Gloeophyllum trabeum ATCC 11539]EPQ56352.1 ubiquitin carboxyl-terminal hydrolase-like protein isozyme L3 [Gloeophyllum trabeum ATCC 11539]
MAGSRWIPLESNPEVLNTWAQRAGLVTSQAQFEDVYGLDPELLAMVSKPVKAIIMLFPISDEYEAKRKDEDEALKKQESKLDPTLFFIKQTIGNACGTIALIHALANSDIVLAPGSPLANFIDQCQDKTPEERAKLLETTEIFANIHADTASSGQTAAPSADEKVELHFTCFVEAPTKESRNTEAPSGAQRLVELDGRRVGPIDRGPCTDLLNDVAKFIKERYIAGSSSMQFSVMSLGPPAH